MTESKILQRDFWAAFCEYVKEQGSNIKTTKPLPPNWMNIAIGRSGMRLCAVASLWDSVAYSFSSHELRTELVLDDNNSKNYFTRLETEKEEIENKIGEQLTWHNPPEKRMCRIYIRKSTNLQDKNVWSEQHAWLLEKLELFYKIFASRVRKLETK